MVVTDFELASEEGGEDDRGPFYNSVYNVRFTGGFSAAALKLGAATAGLPTRGSTRTDDASVVAKKVSCKLKPGDGAVSAGVAEYRVEWGIYPPTGNNVQNNVNPLARLPEIKWGGADITIAVTIDVNGDPILNAANDPYDNPPVDFIRASTVTITRNEQANPATVVNSYSNTTNSATMWGNVSAKNGLMQKIEAVNTSEVFNGTLIKYWRVTYPMTFRRDGWYYKPLNVGWQEINATTNKKQLITAPNGQPYNTPQPLDANGHKATTFIVWPSGGWEIKDSLDWSVLNLPNPFI